MTDPAIEAAQRAVEFEATPGAELGRFATATVAAREALAPIRADIEDLRRFCSGCSAEHILVRSAVDRIARHVYPSEEL